MAAWSTPPFVRKTLHCAPPGWHWRVALIAADTTRTAEHKRRHDVEYVRRAVLKVDAAVRQHAPGERWLVAHRAG